MDITTRIKDLAWLRRDIIGRNMIFETPFGQRPLVYADYTASGRGLSSMKPTSAAPAVLCQYAHRRYINWQNDVAIAA
jgi:hypothetical protein